MERTCVYCGAEKDERSFKQSPGSYLGNICRNCRTLREHTALRVQMFDALGKVCACCGESNPLFLSLDHIKNDGAEYRRKTGHTTYQTIRLARREGWPRDKYQILCNCCNTAKGHYGECPHKSGRTTEVVWAEYNAILARTNVRHYNFQKVNRNPKFKEERPWKSEEMRGRKFPSISAHHMGNKYAKRKLTEDQVREIRKMFAEGATIKSELSRKFGVSRSVIRRIIRRIGWKDVE